MNFSSDKYHKRVVLKVMSDPFPMRDGSDMYSNTDLHNKACSQQSYGNSEARGIATFSAVRTILSMKFASLSIPFSTNGVNSTIL